MGQFSKCGNSFLTENTAEIDSLITEFGDAARELSTEVQMTCESCANGSFFKAEQNAFDQLREILSSALITRQKLAIDKHIVHRMRDAVGDAGRTDEVTRDYPNAILQIVDPEQMSEFRKFNATCQRVGQDECVTLEASSTSIGVDPITKRAFVHPVRNIRCGHIYEKAAIESMIAMSTGGPLTCVWFGCKNRIPLTLQDLRPISRSEIDRN